MASRFIGRLKCMWSGHRAGDYEKVSSQAIKFTCRQCKNKYVYNERTESMIPWDEKVSAFYEDFAELEKRLPQAPESTE